MRHIVVASLVVAVAPACAHQAQMRPQQMSYAAPSAYGSMSSSSFDDDEDGGGSFSKVSKAHFVAPHRARASTDGAALVVRPDVLTTELAIRHTGATPQAALAAARAVAADVVAKLAAGTGRQPTLKMRGVSAAKVVRRDRVPGVVVTVDGLIEISLPPDLDFWSRGQLYATLLDLTARLAYDAGSTDDPLRALSFTEVVSSVRDPESFRPQLTDRWIARVRAFAAQAQSDRLPLSLVDCAPPRAITQTQISLEETTLELPFTCRLDAAPGPHAHRPD